MSHRYVIVDLETTGHSPAHGDRIIQIGAVKVEAGHISERFTTYVNPKQEIPPFITELTGIDNEDVGEAPLFEEVAKELLAFMEGCDFVAHNVPFDKGFLEQQLQLEGYSFPNGSVFDTVEMSRVLWPKQISYKLTELSTSLDLDHNRPHQADSDAYSTAELFLALLHTIETLPLLTLQQLLPIGKRLKSDWQQLLDPLIRMKLKSGETGEDDYDCYRQLALKKQEVGSSSAPEEPVTTFEEAQELLFGEDGTFAQAFSSYETRLGQTQMMHEVNHAFREHQHALIEAGTGTGKSLAYLLPAAYYAKQAKKPVVISTYTIPLQEQLLKRDLPLLEAVTPFPVHVAVLKGRRHYLDLRKFEQSLASIAEDSYDVLITKAQLHVWLLETERGDVEELNLTSGGRNFWFQVQSDGASDLGKYNPWASRCFYHRARQATLKAELVITNHALLLTDVTQAGHVLPSYSHAVIDEAHHLEEAAGDYFGVKTDYVSLSFVLQKLDRNEEQSVVGTLEEIGGRLAKTIALQETRDTLSLVKEDVDELFRMLHAYTLKASEQGPTDIGRASHMYKSFSEKGTLWQGVLECAMRIQMNGESVLQAFEYASAVLTEASETMSYIDRSRLADAKTTIAIFSEHLQALYELLLEYDETFAYWMEAEPKGAKNATYLVAKPIQVAEQLADRFFAKKKSVVLTSATLTVNGSFSYQVQRLGLEDFGVKTVHVPSPFAYEKQAKLLVPSDLPPISARADELFASDVAIKIWRIAEVTREKVLVLFTSYELLRKVYYYVKDLNSENLVQLIGQGVTSGSRSRLLKLFRNVEQGILFGTNSFWEGVDLPGTELGHLVIVRLPFAPPNEPLMRAQIEQAKDEGRNPFTDLSLPQAVIRFKQGFGRLIRTKEDVGCVFVFDRRIVTARYGKAFVRSLPNVPMYEGKLEDLLQLQLEFGEEES
ncbi:ATP-dependent DNA helicase DinG [Shouchella shacheensis]|uniref:ATP-dependent DNA helicase DinG n=1 Tax=Shouchella shacheensis TaxID=1649580 RepID=UPI000740067F|nr:ATP-dependent DNA helicase DinG [Shouchella shacheensis]